MILFIVMNFIAGITAFLITRGAFGFYDITDSIILWFSIYFSQIVLSELILGIAGKLYTGNLVLLNTAFLLMAIFYCKSFPPFEKGRIKGGFPKGIFDNRVILFCISILLGFGIVKIFINLVNPPFGWDCLNYHFSFPVAWMKHGDLRIMTTIADDPSPPYYPINANLLFLWLIMPLKNVFLADLGQAPFFILAFLSIYNICKKLGVNRELSFYSAGLFLITPNVFKQLEIAYVDVALAALFLAGLNFLASLCKKFNAGDFFAFSICFGLFIGIKTSAVIYGIFLPLLLTVILLKNLKQIGISRLITYLLLFSLITAILGGFSYIRNFIITGNALYPAEIKILGKKIFHGGMPFSTYRDKWTSQDYNLSKLLFHEGMGIQFLVFMVPAFILSLPVLIHRLLSLKGKNSLISIYILSLPVSLYLAFWFFMPQLWVRYLYPFIACGFIAAAYLSDIFHIPKNLIRALAVICFIASAIELSGHLELISSVVLSVLFFFLSPKIIKYYFKSPLNPPFYKGGKFRGDLLIFPVLILIALYFLNLNYNNNEFRRYLKNTPYPQEEREGWFWLNNHANNAKIAYTGSPDTLPLYGANFKNDAVYVSVNNTHPVKLHYFPDAKYIWSGDFLSLHKNLEKTGNYRQNPDFDDWLSNLRYENADYLFIYSLHQVKSIIFPVEDTWAKSHPEIFDSVFTNQKVHIYKIK